MRTRIGLKILVVSVLVASVAAAAPAYAADRAAVPGADATDSVGVMTKPTSMPIARSGGAAIMRPLAATKTCTKTSDTRSVCVAPAKPSLRTSPASMAATIPFPLWCTDSDGTPIAASRTEACQVTGLILTTTQTVNGTTTVTGELNMDVYDYTYASVDLPNWAHQIGLSPWSGWGAAVNSTVTGTMTAAGECVTLGVSDFPVQSLSPVNNIMRSCTAGAETTATAVGAIGYCTTIWNLVFVPAGYPAANASSSMAEISCDTAIGANGSRPPRVGCVVPWFPALAVYSQSSYPSPLPIEGWRSAAPDGPSPAATSTRRSA
jgi:hypothetical protein